MAANPSISTPFLIFFAILLIYCFQSSSSLRTTATKTSHGSFRVPIIDRDSPLSPFYDPNITIYDQSRGLVRRSVARLKHLQASMVSPDYLVTAPLGSEDIEYIIKFWIGTPPFEVTAVLDTGSLITWFQCLPCEQCFEQSRPIFDPSKSSSYKNIICDSPTCNQLPSRDCENYLCNYGSTYADGSFTKGSFATEKFTFDTADRRNISLLDVSFGCGHKNGGTFKGNMNGIVSMGQGPLSLINQLYLHEFAHCFLPRGDPGMSHLQLGESPLVFGATTPILGGGFSDSFYYMSLEDISLGSEALHIDLRAFKPSKSQGLVLDTGTSINILDSTGFDPVVQAVHKAMTLKQIPDPREELELCYEGTIYEDLDGFPPLIFHFTNGADLALEPFSNFLQVADQVLCLAMMRNDGGISIIGNLAMQNYNIGYNLLRKTISFERDDCQYL